MGWPVFLLGPGLGPGQGQGPVCSQAGVGRALDKIIFPKLPHVCRVVWRGKAPDPSLLSADVTAFTNYRLGL